MIAIIDDDLNTLKLLEFMLRKEFEYVTFAYPVEFLEWFKTHYSEVDLVLVDYKMPICNGASLVKKIREISNAEIIVMTAQVTKDIIAELFESGVNEVLQKPFEHDFLEKIRYHLKINKYIKGS